MQNTSSFPDTYKVPFFYVSLSAINKQHSKVSTGYPSILLRLCAPSQSHHWKKKALTPKVQMFFSKHFLSGGSGFFSVTQGIAWKTDKLTLQEWSRLNQTGSILALGINLMVCLLYHVLLFSPWVHSDG